MAKDKMKTERLKALLKKRNRHLFSAARELRLFWETVAQFEQEQGDAMYGVHDTFYTAGIDTDDVEKFIETMTKLADTARDHEDKVLKNLED